MTELDELRQMEAHVGQLLHTPIKDDDLIPLLVRIVESFDRRLAALESHGPDE